MQKIWIPMGPESWWQRGSDNITFWSFQPIVGATADKASTNPLPPNPWIPEKPLPPPPLNNIALQIRLAKSSM